MTVTTANKKITIHYNDERQNTNDRRVLDSGQVFKFPDPWGYRSLFTEPPKENDEYFKNEMFWIFRDLDQIKNKLHKFDNCIRMIVCREKN
jgi:hypothetical protein